MHKFISPAFLLYLSLGCSAFSVVGAAHSNQPDKWLTEEAPLKFTAVGSAKFSFLFWDIYQSILYTPSGRYFEDNSAEPLLFEIEYLIDITADDLVKSTVEQWQHLNFSEAQYHQYIPLLKAMWPDISSGDKLALLIQNQQSTFYFNKVKVGVIEQKAFGDIFLAIWLSKNTSQPSLRAQLLGEKNHE